MRVLGLAVIAVVLAGAAHAQGRFAIAGVADEAVVVAFLSDLQRASARGDRQALAAMVRFPIVVTIGTLRVPIPNASAFLERFDLIFTAELKEAIARTSAAAGAASPLLATADGLFIGRTMVTIVPVGTSLKIAAIVVPQPGVSGGAGAGGGSRATPRRISVRAGPNPTQMQGSLAAGAIDSYLLRVAQGQMVEIRIEGVPGRDIVARIFEVSTNVAVDARAKEGLRAWSGRARANGDYRIDVVRLAPGQGVLTYTLAVRAR